MRGTPARFVDFRGGVNTKASPYLVDQKEARDARNVVSTTRGSVRKRDGCQTYATPAATMASLQTVEATPTRVLFGVTTGNQFQSIDGAGVVTTVTYAPAITNSRWEFVQAPAQTLGPLFGVNGVDTPMTWTGSGAAAAWTLTSGATPNGKYLAYHSNRVFMANLAGGTGVYGTVSDPGSALVFSDIANPRSFPLSNIVLFDPNDGDQITGLGKVGPYLLVFKRRKMFLVYDPDIGANRRLSDTVGCCANRSIAESPHGTYFLTLDRGVYVTNGSSLHLASDNLAPTLDSIAPARRALSSGTYFNYHYYLSVSTLTPNLDLTLDLDTTINSWWLHDFAANQWAAMQYTSTLDLYAANPNAASVSKAFVPGITQDNGVNFTAYWKGPWQSFGAPFLRKRMRQVHLDGVGPFDVYVSQDFAVGDTLAKSGVCPITNTTYGGSDLFGGIGLYGDASTTREDRIFSLGVARSWSVGFRATTSGAMEVDSYTMAYTSRRN